MFVCDSLCKIQSQVILINEDLTGRMHRKIKKVRILGTWAVVKEIQEKPSTQPE